MKQHIKPEDRSPSLQRYYDRKGTPEGDADAKRARKNAENQRKNPVQAKRKSDITKDWYDNKGGKEIRKKQYEKTRDNGVRKERRDDRRAVLIEHMGGVCSHSNCNETERLQFDHIDPMTKSHNINPQDSYEKSFKELEKCQLLCPKHHLEKTFIKDFDIILKKKFGV